MKVFFSLLIALAFLSESYGQNKEAKRYLKVQQLVFTDQWESALSLIHEAENDGDLEHFHILQYNKAACLYRMQFSFNAIDSVLQFALEVEKSNIYYDLTKGNSYWLYASMYRDLENLDQCANYISKAVKHFDKSTSAYGSLISNLGFIQIELERYEKAIETFDKSIKHDPKNAYAYNNRALAKLNLCDLKGALEDLDISSKLDSKNPYLFKHYALVYLEQKRTAKACKMLEKSKNMGYYEYLGHNDNEVNELLNEHCK
ncbi:MAG: tetratricopeptide repeat protein [Flavobacteriales bacterium]